MDRILRAMAEDIIDNCQMCQEENGGCSYCGMTKFCDYNADGSPSVIVYKLTVEELIARYEMWLEEWI